MWRYLQPFRLGLNHRKTGRDHFEHSVWVYNALFFRVIFGFLKEGGAFFHVFPQKFAEAALGADITVPTLTGDTVKIRIPAGTASGRTFRLRGKGGDKGDLLVTASVVVPDDLSAEQRSAVEAFAAASNDSPRAHLGV